MKKITVLVEYIKNYLLLFKINKMLNNLPSLISKIKNNSINHLITFSDSNSDSPLKHKLSPELFKIHKSKSINLKSLIFSPSIPMIKKTITGHSPLMKEKLFLNLGNNGIKEKFNCFVTVVLTSQ
jgi:hypothetical protein